MAVRTYRDAKGRTRYLVEFAQKGRRILRRCPPGIGRAEAQEYETTLRREIFAAVDLGRAPEITLEEAILRWLRDTLANKKDQKKPRQNALLLAPFVQGKSLRQVAEAAREAQSAWTRPATARQRPANVGNLRLRAATVAGLTPATINRRLCVLKAAAKHAYKQGWIDENLSGRITMLREENKREVYLTATDVRLLAGAAPSPHVTAAIMIAAYSGLRASELLALPRTPTQSATLTVLTSKSGKPRQVPIAGPARRYLSALPLGMSYDQLHKQFCKARKAAGMPHVRFHDLRHTTASLLANAGVDLYVIGAILGHSSPQTTARYAHLAQGTLKKAMGKLR
jgi:integrase